MDRGASTRARKFPKPPGRGFLRGLRRIYERQASRDDVILFAPHRGIYVNACERCRALAKDSEWPWKYLALIKFVPGEASRGTNRCRRHRKLRQTTERGRMREGARACERVNRYLRAFDSRDTCIAKSSARRTPSREIDGDDKRQLAEKWLGNLTEVPVFTASRSSIPR